MSRDPKTCAYWVEAVRDAARIVAPLDLPESSKVALQVAIERALCDAFEAGTFEKASV